MNLINRPFIAKKSINYTGGYKLCRQKLCVVVSMLLVVNAYSHAGRAEDLIAVYNQAALEDPQLEKAKEALAAVQESRAQTSANLFQPVINITSGVSKDWQNINNYGGCEPFCQNGPNNFYSWNYFLNLTQPILHYDRFVQWQQSDKKDSSG